MEHPEITGPVNITAPGPVTNRHLTKSLASAVSRPTLLPPVPAAVLRVVLGEFSRVLVRGQRVVPKKLMDAGFVFRYSEIDEALENAVG
jgi:NAD dependent epimerase/dehydratase family enzyme